MPLLGMPFNILIGGYHFWIELVTKALRKGALADTLNRFPLIAKVFKAAMPNIIEALIQDTRTHEAHTMALIQRYIFCILQLESRRFLILKQRRIKNPSSRPDFLTRILENRENENISDVQLAAHASDFV